MGTIDNDRPPIISLVSRQTGEHRYWVCGGCRNGTALWKEIVEQGYTGKRSTIFSFVTRLRKALGIPAKNRSIRAGKVAVPEERPCDRHERLRFQ
jgi:hypothetical protein